MNGGTAAKLLASLAALAAFLYLAATQTIGGKLLGVVLLALVLWSLYPEHHLESGLAIIAVTAYYEASLDLQDFIQRLIATYGGSGFWIILSGFVLAKGMESSGLGRRLALVISTSLGCNPRNILLAVALASLAISPLSPSTTAKAFLLLPVCTGLAEALGARKGGRFGASLMLMATAANNVAATGFLTATVPNPISAQYLQAAGLTLTWTGWLVMALPITVIIIAASYLLLSAIIKPEVDEVKESYEVVCGLRERLGPITRGEKTTAMVFSVCLALWIGESAFPFNAGLASLIISLILLLPQAGVMDLRGFASSVPYGSIVLFAASIFLARAVERFHALDPVANWFFAIFDVGSLGSALFVGVVVALAMLLHAAFTSTTVYATVIVPIVLGITELKQLPPSLVGLPVAFLAPIAMFLPVNTIPNLVFFKEGWFTEKQLLAYGAALSAASVAIVLLIGIPYWMLLGLI